MNQLSLVEQFEGKWDNCIVLTYTISLSFFEAWVWRRMAGRVRSCVLLADGDRYMEELETAAEGGLVRMAGVQYVCDGVFAPHAHHPKLILLTSETDGRLLVGSGNLTWSGFAGAELYTRYDYDPEDASSVNAFAAAREVLQGLVAAGYVQSGIARERVEGVLVASPWLLAGYREGPKPVRHNLSTDFLTQFTAEVGDDPVEELVLMAPFFDPGARAAGRMVEVLRPNRATILVQPGETSVDARALQKLQARYPQVNLRSFSKPGGSEYVHAKFYLARTKTSTYCLQGSPNLSQVALLQTVPNGNVEVANLLTGPPSAFGDVLASLTLGPITTPEKLDLRLKDFEAVVALPSWRTTTAEWSGTRLRFRHVGPLPDLADLGVEVGGDRFPAAVISISAEWLDFHVSNDVTDLLRRGLPVRVAWTSSGDRQHANWVFASGRQALDDLLRLDRRAELIERFESAGLGEDEFAELIEALEGLTVLDESSIAGIAGKGVRSTAGSVGQEVELAYEDVNWTAIAAHPRLQQYRVGSGTSRLPLQMLLAAFARHLGPSSGKGGVPHNAIAAALSGLDDPEVLDVEVPPEAIEAEGEAAADKREEITRKRLLRIQGAVQRVAVRYLRGLSSEAFMARVGPDVAAQNYRLVTQLLGFCVIREWCAPSWGIHHLVGVWAGFWGANGYFENTTDELRARALSSLGELASMQASLLGLSAYGARLSRLEGPKSLRFALRDLWRQLMVSTYLQWSRNDLAFAAKTTERLDVQLTGLEVFGELERLLVFETEASFIAFLAGWLGDVDGTPEFDSVVVARPALGSQSSERRLLVASERAFATPEMASAVIGKWMSWEAADYYRIEHPQPKPWRRAFWDAIGESGVWVLGGDVRDLKDIPLPGHAWRQGLLDLSSEAANTPSLEPESVAKDEMVGLAGDAG